MDVDLLFGNAGDWAPGFTGRALLSSILAGVALVGTPREMLARGPRPDAWASDTDTEPLAVASG